jgi:hypothetical protein
MEAAPVPAPTVRTCEFGGTYANAFAPVNDVTMICRDPVQLVATVR